jgi:type IV secretion system protein TrbL
MVDRWHVRQAPGARDCMAAVARRKGLHSGNAGEQGEAMVTPMLLFLFQAPVIADPSSLTAVYEGLIPQWINNVKPYAAEFFGALAVLQFAVFGWRLWRRHGGDDIRGALASTTNEVLVMGTFLTILLNGPVWMQAVINMFIDVGKAGSGVAAIQPSNIIKQGLAIFGAMTAAAEQNAIFTGPLTPLALAVLFAGIMVVFAFIVICMEFVVTKVQTFLVLGMGLFFLAFGGSSWTRSYVERYFAYAVSSGVRLMTLYFLIGAGGALGNHWVQQASAAPWSLAGAQACLLIMTGALIYAVICFRAPAMAAQILGGGPNLSHNEVFSGLGQVVGAGVTAALVASGIGSAAAGAGRAASGALGAGGGGASVGGSAPTSGDTPTVSPVDSGSPNGNGSGSGNGGGTPVSRPKVGSNGMVGAAVMTATTLKGMGGGGHQVNPPRFNGFSDN